MQFERVIKHDNKSNIRQINSAASGRNEQTSSVQMDDEDMVSKSQETVEEEVKTQENHRKKQPIAPREVHIEF